MRIVGKVVAVPMIIAVTALKWIAAFLGGMTGWIFRILSIITFLTAVVSYLMQLSTGKEAFGMLIGAFILFVLPYGLGAIVSGLGQCQEALTGFLRPKKTTTLVDK